MTIRVSRDVSRVSLQAVTLLVMLATAPAASHVRSWTATLPDGERLLWLSDGNVTAKQTSVLAPKSEENMTLRQVTDGRRFLQMIYRGSGKLVDCEQSRWGPEAAKSFGPLPNTTALPSFSLRQEPPPTSAQELRALSIDSLAAECRTSHRITKRRRKARIRHHADRRSKRGAKDYLMAPGTNWCGPSNRKAELGPFGEADRCCRRHDRCHANIPGLSRGHHAFNYRPFTVSHCRCDRRFRTCLKMANTGASNFIGKIFFNVVQRKCFILRRGEVCVHRSWWGKCLKMEYKKVAHLVDNMAY